MTPDSYPALFWSYTAVWVLLAAYMIWLGVRLGRIERSLSVKGGARNDSGKKIS